MILLTIVLTLSAFFLIFFQRIIKKINIYDAPDGIRKFQKNKVSCVGGIYFYLVFLTIIIFTLFKDINYSNIYKLLLIQNNKEFFLFLLVTTLLFLIGLYDDKYELNPTIKSVLLLLIIFFYVYHKTNFQITEIRVIFLNQTVFLGNFSVFFTSICIFSLLVASNMFDGSNGQSFINFSSIFIYLLYKGLFFELSYLLIIALLIFSYLNFRNLAYLGDNGVYLISFLASYSIISNYNSDKSIYVEEIIIILFIPILDMIRLFITRIIKGKNPFIPDATHLHHIIQNKYGHNKLVLILTCLFLFPLFALIFLSLNYYLIIILQILSYFYFIAFKKINKIYE